MSLDKIGVAKRIAQELKNTYYVNPGRYTNISCKLCSQKHKCRVSV